MQIKSVLALALIGALAASPAVAKQSRSAKAAAEAADQTLGMALLSANVDSFGVLHGGAGVVSAAKTETGIYAVTFNRSVLGCSFVAAPAFWAPLAAPDVVGEVNVSPMEGDETSVWVRRAGSSGLTGNGSFNLIAFCVQ